MAMSVSESEPLLGERSEFWGLRLRPGPSRRSPLTYILGLLVLSYYAYGSYALMVGWRRRSSGFHWATEGVIWAGVVYIMASQAFILHICWHVLPRAVYLRTAQGLTVISLGGCLPADVMVVLVRPFGDRLGTVGIFIIVTTYFGILITSFVKQHSAPPSSAHDRNDGLLDDLLQYRPDPKMSVTIYGMVWARNFCYLVIVISQIQVELAKRDSSLIAAGLVTGLASATINVSLNILFPGFHLKATTSLLKLLCFLDFIELVIAIALASTECNNVAESIVVLMLLGLSMITLAERVYEIIALYAPSVDAFFFLDNGIDGDSSSSPRKD